MCPHKTTLGFVAFVFVCPCCNGRLPCPLTSLTYFSARTRLGPAKMAGRVHKRHLTDSDLPPDWERKDSTMRRENPRATGGSTPVIRRRHTRTLPRTWRATTCLVRDRPASSADSGSRSPAPHSLETPLWRSSRAKTPQRQRQQPLTRSPTHHVVAYFRSGDLACVGRSRQTCLASSNLQTSSARIRCGGIGFLPLLPSIRWSFGPRDQTGPRYLVAFYDVARTAK